jgi:hypothetical protein
MINQMIGIGLLMTSTASLGTQIFAQG